MVRVPSPRWLGAAVVIAVALSPQMASAQWTSGPTLNNSKVAGTFSVGPTVTAVTDQAQAVGGSTLLPFASTSSPGIAVGQTVAGTNVPIGDTVASIVSAAQVSLAASGISASGQKVVTTTATTGATVGQQCTDITTPAAIGAGNVIASIQAGVSITMTANLTGATATADVITCDPVVTLSTATTAAVAANTSITFQTNGSNVLTPNGGIAAAGQMGISARSRSVCDLGPATGNLTALTPVITTFYYGEVFVPANATVTGVAALNSATISGNVKVGLANSAGIVVATSASTAQAGVSAYQRVPFTAPYAALGPATYYALLFIDNTTSRPQTLTLANCATGSVTGQVYATGFTNFAPATTFAAGVGPVLSLY